MQNKGTSQQPEPSANSKVASKDTRSTAENKSQSTLQPAPKSDIPQKEIQVTSIFTAKPGLEVIFRQELLGYVKETRKNSHCKKITVLTENGNKGSFLLHSTWGSEAAFIEHLGSPIVREYAIKNQKYGDPKLIVRRWTVLENVSDQD